MLRRDKYPTFESEENEESKIIFLFGRVANVAK
jgi:hypothetical protein